MCWLVAFIALVVGLFLAFFLVFNSLYSDVFGPANRLYTFLVVAVAYLIVAFLFGLASPGTAGISAFFLGLPNIAVAVINAANSDLRYAQLGFAYLALAWICAYLGALTGARLRSENYDSPSHTSGE